MLQWKVAVIATEQNQRHLPAAYKHLEALGLSDGIHVFCGQGVKVSENEGVIRQRAKEPRTEREVWIDAITTMSTSSAERTDVFLFTTPDLVFWSGLQDFVDGTLEREFVAVYLPYTPQPFYHESTGRAIPCAQGDAIGWCETPVKEVTAASNALIMHRHTTRLVAAYLQDKKNHAPHSWANTFANVLCGVSKVTMYCAVPSFARARNIPSQQAVYGPPPPVNLKDVPNKNHYLN